VMPRVKIAQAQSDAINSASSVIGKITSAVMTRVFSTWSTGRLRWLRTTIVR
jgi:hypothetical protein